MGVDLGPRLMQGSGDWVGTLPGLGTVIVDESGRITVTVEAPAPDDADTWEQRERALRLGWGEPLSFARRGFRLAAGSAVSPAGGDSAILLIGDARNSAIVSGELGAGGWELVADRPCPVCWSGPDLVAHTRAAPLVMPQRRAQSAGLTGEPLRGDTDAMWVDVPRAPGPRRVAGLVSLRWGRRDEPVTEPLRGHAKLEFVAGMFMTGVLATTSQAPRSTAELAGSASKVFDERVQLSALPAIIFRVDGDAPVDTGALQNWWDGEAQK